MRIVLDEELIRYLFRELQTPAFPFMPAGRFRTERPGMHRQTGNSGNPGVI